MTDTATTTPTPMGERERIVANLTRNGGALLVIVLLLYGLYLYESNRAVQDHEARMLLLDSCVAEPN